MAAVTLFTNQVPVILDANAVEGQPGIILGTAWYSEHDGVVRGVRFYLGSRNYDTAQLTAGLYKADGTLLAQKNYTVSAADATGFVTITLDTPILVQRNESYVAAVYFPCNTSPDGKSHYVATTAFFVNQLDNSPLHGYKSDTILARYNGLYSYGSSLTLPQGSFNSGCYFVDVTFEYVGKFPVYDAATHTYKQHVMKYRQNGQWKF
jgi:hypothetical protein